MPTLRHWMICVGARHAVPLLICAGLMGACGSNEAEPVPANTPSTTMQGDTCVSYEDFAGPFLLNWCVGCHSSSLDEAHRRMAPLDVNFDTLAGVRAHADRIKLRVHELKNMPPLGGPNDEDRALLAEWIDCDLPSTGGGFVPPAPAAGPMMTATPTGACADPRMYVPDAILPRCAASTRDCIVQCGIDNPEYDQEACRNACFAADTTAADTSLGVPINCATCSFAQLLACADEACHEETAAFMCCNEACAGDEACNAECSGELQAFGLCVYYTAPQCVDYVDGPPGQCFATPDPATMADGGTVGPDAAP